MRAIYLDGTQTRFLTDYPIPEPQADEALIRVTMAALCTTDREMMRGYSPGFAGVLGHEFVGVVEQADDTALIGKRVVGEINLSCFSDDCLYCSTGRNHHCESRSALGIHSKDGCFADYVTLPTRLLHVLDDDMNDTTAIFTEPLAASLRILEQNPIAAGTPVALVGDGRLAYMIGQVVASTGADLTVYGKVADKLALFSPFAETVLVNDGHDTDENSNEVAVFETSSNTNKSADTLESNHTYEVVIDATGNPESLAASIALTRSEGLLVMKSTYAGNAEIDMSEVVVRELTIRGSRCGPFDVALDFLRRGLITLPPIKLFAPPEFEQALASHAFKVAFDFS